MIAQTPWTQRKFTFDFPITHFPVIYVRLMGTYPRLEEFIKNKSESMLEEKPEGKWSVKEHIGHLTDLEELHEGRLDDYKNKVGILRPADMLNKKTHDANHNSKSIAILMRDFKKTREEFLNHLSLLHESALSQTAIHPRLQQPMRLVDMAYFVAEHDDQHLAAIHFILGTPGDN